MKFLVQQHYSGYIEREIEAETQEDAENKMLNTDIKCTFNELMDANWDNPTVIRQL